MNIPARDLSFPVDSFDREIKISYVTNYDASDVSGWSGTGNFVARALQRQGFLLDFIGPLSRPKRHWPILKAKGLLYNHLLHRPYHAAHDLSVARHFARKVDRQLRQKPGTHLVFSPGTIPIAFLETDKPIAFWSDATHASLFDFYPEYRDLCGETRRAGHTIEQLAIDRASAVIMSSHWAADSAVRDYGASRDKVHVVPFGANLEDPPPLESVGQAIASRPTGLCKLLFVGIDWHRKGGEVALETAAELNRIGLAAELTIVGCQPFSAKDKPAFVRCEGFLSKKSKTGMERLAQLLAESHFLIVPSMAECFGLVYCEANAYGVPCLARAVGGVPTIVKEGVNGRLFMPEAPATEYARYIEELFVRYDDYLDLARSSAREFNQRLNWKVTGKQVHKILSEVCSGLPRK